MFYWLLRLLAKFLFKILFKFEVRGKENVPKKGGVVIASNHASYLDPVALGVASPRKLNFLAKQELFNSKLFSLLISTLGALPLRQDKPLRAMNEAIRRLSKGKSLVIFPQGGRKREDMLNSIYPGVAFLSLKAGVPIVPALIEGSGLALPIGAKFIRLKKIKVSFGKPLKPGPGMFEGDYERISQEVLKRLKGLRNASESKAED
jgi:1-acyl-sn-glycerol-3-phosphate acyltransferase